MRYYSNEYMKNYKMSRYNLIVRQEDGILIYNTYSGSFGFIEGNNDLNDLSRIDKSLFPELIDGGCIVEKYFDEFENLKKMYYESKIDNKYLSLTLLVSEDCNFSCPYCFIYQHRPIKMNDKVYNSVLKLIEKRANLLKHLKIQFFGGEPLLNHDKNISFLEKVNKIVRNIYKEYGLVTNGYLLNKKYFLDYFNHNVIFYQLTLDGSKDFHNKTRFTESDKNTFDRLINNLEEIKTVKGNFNFVIRINFQSSDDKINELLRYLKNKFEKDKRFHLVFRPIVDFKTRKINTKIDICSEEEGKMRQIEYLLNFYSKDIVGYDEMIIFLPKRIDTWCESVKTNSYIIGADGLVFKCDVEIGSEKYALGFLKENGDIDLKDNIYEKYDPYKEKSV